MTTVKSLTRQQSIVAFIREFGEVTVDQIVEAFNISQPTVRRDLNALREQGFIRKKNGKITTLNQPKVVDPEFDGPDVASRLTTIEAIGKAASDTVGDSDIVFIGPGAIPLNAAGFIARKPGVIIQTCSLRHASLLRHSPTSAVWVIGGKVDSRTGYVIGGFALNILRKFHADTVIISCTGIDLTKGVLLPSGDIIPVLQEALQNGTKRILVADRSRFTGEKTGVILPFENIDQVITERCIDPDSINKLEEHGLEVLQV